MTKSLSELKTHLESQHVCERYDRWRMVKALGIVNAMIEQHQMPESEELLNLAVKSYGAVFNPRQSIAHQVRMRSVVRELTKALRQPVQQSGPYSASPEDGQATESPVLDLSLAKANVVRRDGLPKDAQYGPGGSGGVSREIRDTGSNVGTVGSGSVQSEAERHNIEASASAFLGPAREGDALISSPLPPTQQPDDSAIGEALTAFQSVRSEYQQSDGTVDLGEMYHYACLFESALHRYFRPTEKYEDLRLLMAAEIKERLGTSDRFAVDATEVALEIALPFIAKAMRPSERESIGGES